MRWKSNMKSLVKRYCFELFLNLSLCAEYSWRRIRWDVSDYAIIIGFILNGLNFVHIKFFLHCPIAAGHQSTLYMRILLFIIWCICQILIECSHLFRVSFLVLIYSSQVRQPSKVRHKYFTNWDGIKLKGKKIICVLIIGFLQYFNV